MNATVLHPISFSFGSDPCASQAEELLERAHQRAQTLDLTYAGRLTAHEAWHLHTTGAGRILDVRTNEERKFVGHVPETLHVAWQTGTSLNKNPRFVREVETKAGKDSPIFLLCRSGKRSHDAATALATAGFSHVYNIDEGFEGDLDDKSQRGLLGGWRLKGLPWIQD